MTKKSKCITIGLLALSIASCTNKPPRHHYPQYTDNVNTPNYYVRQDDNDYYYPGDYHYPIWFFHSCYYSPYYGYTMRPGVVYHTTIHTNGSVRSGFQSTSGGRSVSVSHSSVSRGGFGRSASASS